MKFFNLLRLIIILMLTMPLQVKGQQMENKIGNKIYVFLFDGFSDWEIAYLSPEIMKNERYELIYFSQNGHTVTSMGGLTITPDIAMNEISVSETKMLILPGGTAWETNKNDFIDTMVKDVFESEKTIAAICAATVYLGKKGFLNHLNHTSNALYYLQGLAPEYKGEKFYIDSEAVTGKNVITANGIATIEFAREIFKALNLYNDENIEKWYQLYKHGIWVE